MTIDVSILHTVTARLEVQGDRVKRLIDVIADERELLGVRRPLKIGALVLATA